MCSNSEHVIELLHTQQTIEHGTDNFRRRSEGNTATRLEHMFDIKADCGYIRPYERQRETGRRP
jgi:hypothetical protein